MKNKINPGLKWAFAVHALVALVIGLGYLAIPETVGTWANWEMSNPAYRVIGAFLVALGVSSGAAALAEAWLEVRIKVMLELVWAFVGTLVVVWALITDQVPVSGWLFVAVFVVFFAVFGYFGYVEQQEEAAILHPSHG